MLQCEEEAEEVVASFYPVRVSGVGLGGLEDGRF